MNLGTFILLIVLSTTSACDENQFDTERLACESNVTATFYKSLEAEEDEDLFDKTCKLIENKVQCRIEVESRYDCWTPEEENNVRSNFLLEEYEKALDHEEVMGQDFIDACPLLDDFVKNYTLFKYGANINCSLLEAEQALKDMRACESKLIKQWNFLDSYAFNTYTWKHLYCLDHFGERKCLKLLHRCMDEEKQAENLASYEEYWNEREAEIQQTVGYEEFHYADCIKYRSKRFAVESDLSEMQIQHLKLIGQKRNK